VSVVLLSGLLAAFVALWRVKLSAALLALLNIITSRICGFQSS